MEVKNGIIIDGVLHELVREKHTIPKAVAKFAIACADALIDELRDNQ